MAVSEVSERPRAAGAERAAEQIAWHCEPLPPPDDAQAFGACFERFGDARVVLLGEASHGSSEFYRARAAITRHLIEHHGFSIVAVEADWPDAARIDAYVRERSDLPPAEGGDGSFERFPTWMWRNTDVERFVGWLREHNAARPPAGRVEFRGLDVYSLAASMRAVLDYLDHVDPEEARRARDRYACLTPWQHEPSRYGMAVWVGEKSPCEDAATAQLRSLLDSRMLYLRRDGEAFLDAAQNARIVRAAEHYYRIMFRGSNESWNLRDRHMFDTLSELLAARGEGAKAIVWAHNSHIGNAAATQMGWQGQFNIGELCRKAFSERAALIGFGTDRGTVAAADDWDEPMQVMSVVPARRDSYEAVFHDAAGACSLTEWRSSGRAELRAALAATRLERAIGVVYRPRTEFASHYFEAELSQQFDAFVWFDETTAVTPLPAQRPHGVPDTYPFGT